MFGEIIIKHDYNLEGHKIGKPRVIIDAGANIGLATLIFLHSYEKSHVVSIEADTNTFRYLKKNIQANKLEHRVKLINAALSDKDTKKIYFYTSNKAGSLVSSLSSKRGGKKRVATKNIKLSSITKNFKMVDILKLDIEGSETDVINDLSKKDELKKINSFLIEYHHNINIYNKLGNFLSVLECNSITYQIIANIEEFQQPNIQDILVVGSRVKS